MDLENFHKTTAKNLLDLLQYLKCPICLDIIENVRELPCSHVFCNNCIDLCAEGKSEIVCPLCKKDVPKRIYLSRDAGFDNICSFMKHLTKDLKEHNVDDSTLFGPVIDNKIQENANNSVALDVKPQSSDENDVIPCTVKQKENKKPKKNNRSTYTRRKPLNIKSAVKKENKSSKEVEVSNGDKNLGTHSNVLMKSKQLKKQSDGVARKKNVIQAPIPQSVDNKSKILQWLYDTRNIFERFSQTQIDVSQKDVLLDIDMPSVSQMVHQKPINKNINENEKVDYSCRRARSVENLGNKEIKSLKRHSLECSTPSNFKQYQNSNEIESIENQLILRFMEDEVLDVIDKKVSDEKYTSNKTMKTYFKKENSDSKRMNLAENKFLDELDRNCVNGKIKTYKGKKRTKVENDKNFKSSWRSISNFKKSIGKCKGPRKLNISLESSQKHSKKNTQTEIKGSHETSSIAVKSKTVDFQKMEDYLSKAIPEMIKNNIPSTSQEILREIEEEKKLEQSNIFQERCLNIEEESGHQKHLIDDLCSDKSGSDIYIYQTQPLSKDVTNFTCNKIESALEYAKKLETLLISDKLEPIHNKITISSVYRIIKNIYENLNHNEAVKHIVHNSSQTFDSRNNMKLFDEKEIQTDVFSLDGFNITPTAAFKSLNYEDKETQTENVCENDPLINEMIPVRHKKTFLSSDRSSFETEKFSDANLELLSTSCETKSGKKNSLKCAEVEQKHFKSKNVISQNSLKNIIIHTSHDEQNKNLELNVSSRENKKKVPDQCELREDYIGNCGEIEERGDIKSNSSISNSKKIVLNKTANVIESVISINPTENSVKCDKEISDISNKKSIIDSSVVQNLNEKPVIIEKKTTLNQSQNEIVGLQTELDENLDCKNSEMNLTPDSVIMYSLASSKSKVNRKLMFEKAIQDRTELTETLKRVHTEDSNLESEDEIPNKLICNKFLQDDLSIVFESETQFCNENVKVTQATKSSSDKGSTLSSEANYSKEKPFTNLMVTKTQKEVEHTQTGALLNYCDELIAKANDKISTDNKLFSQNIPQLSQNNKKEIVLEKVTNKKKEETQEKFSLIRTQDLLSHYDDLIAKANQHIIKNDQETKIERKAVGITYGTSQIPTTSEVLNEFEKGDQLFNKEKEVISEKSLGYCSKPPKQSANEQSQVDDEFFYQNLDKLDSVVEKANENKNKIMENKYSESLFESYKDIDPIEQLRSGIQIKHRHVINENNHLRNQSANEDASSSSNPKRRNSDIDNEREVKKIKILQHVQLDTEIKAKENKNGNFSSSEDEIFSDVDIVETTPQKEKDSNFLERLSCSQALDRSTRISSKIVEHDSIPVINIDIVPPPPGFEDDNDDRLKKNSSVVHPVTQRESENIIPNSLSPDKIEPMLIKKSLKSSNSNTKDAIDCPDVPKYFQQFTEMSPICEEKTTVSVMEMVHQSKFSPLTILPRLSPAPSPLTSTPKQKSILNYVTQNSKSTQNKKSGSLSQVSNLTRAKPCIAFSRLDKMEIMSISSLCSKKLVSCQNKFGPEVTHMIVSTNKHNRVKDITMKYISAIAAGLWVLDFSWIQECLAQNKIVDEELYEVLDISGVPSPRISRLSRLTNPLFKGFKFYVVGPFAKISFQELVTVIELLSGTIVHSINDLLKSEDYTCVIIADESENSENDNSDIYQRWLDTHKLITVDFNWISLSVSRYKLLSFKTYLLVSLDYVHGLEYPQDLLVDVPSSCTQQNTCD
ncbi:hypothetical protein WA026_000846 [Henosepilachna vigintioctopunctata]|uniref:RING-type E3 ubiquitin transferase BRCA1 n=1 Tax=Henosepilachna vigintioctopunctata TaxID=420089 RepID=A0AAW1V8I3_9CUCU